MTTANGVLPVLQVVLLANYYNSSIVDAIYYVLGIAYIIYTTFIHHLDTDKLSLLPSKALIYLIIDQACIIAIN
jgi:hypothetical protein